MDFELFFGRFHPLIVHLPIGFILLAIIFEGIGLFKKSIIVWKRPVLFALFFGIIASIFTITTGLLLASDSSYDSTVLDRHKLLGISVLVLSTVIFTIKLKSKEYSPGKAGIFMTLLVVSISLTGHYGGNLTHGESYLFEYAPELIRKIAGIETKTELTFDKSNPDSIQIYRDILKPVFNQKCVQCHGADKQSGKLNLEYHHLLFSAAENEIPVIPGNHIESELFNRVSISHTEKKFMPPKGSPLSYAELSILKYWIQQGADSLMTFDLKSMDEELLGLMIRDYGLDLHPKPYYERVTVDTVPNAILSSLIEIEFRVEYLSESNNLLDIRFTGKDISESDIQLLDGVKNNVTFLNLSSCNLTDELINQLSDFANLTSLNLHSNAISDEGISPITSYANLEVLNLYGTEISDQGLKRLLNMPSLIRVYVWETNVTQNFVSEIAGSAIEVISGYNSE